jgi:hypothetical protein
MTQEIRDSIDTSKIARKLYLLRQLSPVGYPWAAKEIEKLEAMYRELTKGVGE